VRREAIAIQQPAKERGERVVGKAECAALALERCRREQPPVEEGDVAEDPRRRRTFGTRCVERAEEQRTQQTVMQRTPAFQMGRRLPQQELRVVIEPPFGLQEMRETDSATRTEWKAPGVLQASLNPWPYLPGW
jgi:hypothetical protein